MNLTPYQRDRAMSGLADAGIPAKDTTRILAGALVETAARAGLRAAIAAGARLVVLCGPPGVGKTTAAAELVADELLPTLLAGSYPMSYRPPVFVDTARLSRWPRFNERRMEELELSPLVVVDDLGAELLDERGAFLSLLDGLVNVRYAAELRTVITTNVPPSAFEERYGSRIADRVREAGRFVPVTGASMRGRTA